MDKSSLRPAGLPARAVQWLFAALAASLLSGCLDYDEEMWLNSDLSGEVAMTLTLPDTISDPRLGVLQGLTEDRVRKDVESSEGLKLMSFESFKENGKQVTRIRIEFASVEKLGWLGGSKPNSGSILGTITVGKENGHPVFKRSLGAAAVPNTSITGEELLTRGLATLLVGTNYLVYTVHFPGEVLNANSTQIEKRTNTVRWKFPLSQTMAEQITMRAEWKGGGWLLWLIGAVVALAGAGLGWKVWSARGNG